MKYLALLSIGFLALTSCSKRFLDNPNAGSISILCLGDSRVDGDRPEYEHYRYELWKLLLDSSYTVDFIGTENDDVAYPDHLGFTFDDQHEGVGGIRTKGLLKNVRNLRFESSPQFVLLCVGGNDLLEGKSVDKAISNISKIICELQKDCPETTIILEQIAPAHSSSMTSELDATLNDFNSKLPGLTSEYNNLQIVDMNTGFTDLYFADDVHYNELGAREVAQRYFAAMQSFL